TRSGTPAPVIPCVTALETSPIAALLWHKQQHTPCAPPLRRRSQRKRQTARRWCTARSAATDWWHLGTVRLVCCSFCCAHLLPVLSNNATVSLPKHFFESFYDIYREI